MKPEFEAAINCDSDPAAIDQSEALTRILKQIPKPKIIESCSLNDCLGRVLARSAVSSVNVPNHTNSAMDGYAFLGSGTGNDQHHTLQLIGKAFAGAPYTGTVKPGECIRIMTGAVMPKGTDTVVMQEQTTENALQVQLESNYKPKQNVRYAGEDIKTGDTVLPVGHRILAADTGILASIGLTRIDVYQRPTVAFFSTGDELVAAGEPLKLGDVYDSNRHTLRAMLQQQGVKVLDLGIVPDNLDKLRAVLQDAARQADCILSSAGASVGEADYIHQALAELGQVNFWKVAIKPGKPLAFGQIAETPYFGLPGNPVSVMATFAFFVLPALRQLSGSNVPELFHLKATIDHKLRKKPGRTEYQRAIVREQAGVLHAQTTGQQGSGILCSMSLANAFIVLPSESESVTAGSKVDILLFNQLYG